MESKIYPPTLSPTQALSNYVDALFSITKNPSVLLVDTPTMSALSVVASQTDILKNNILLVDKIENELREKNSSLDCVVLCRCTKSNVEYLRREIGNPKYGVYTIIFTSPSIQEDLEDIAQCDKKECIQGVYEFYLDYHALDEYLFTLDIPSLVPMLGNARDQSQFRRMSEGLTAALLSFQKLPTIYFQENSDICKQLAETVNRECYGNQERFKHLERMSKKDKKNTILLIMDRRDDPITPLLTQWTYQAMVHENLGQKSGGIKLNRVTLEDSSPPLEVVLSSKDDEFFRANMINNWGDLCLNIKEMVDQYMSKMNVRDDIKSIDDIRSFITNYPQFKQFSNQVEKHAAVVHALRDTINSRNLLELSKLEQAMATSSHPKDHFKWLSRIIEDPSTSKRDIIRLSILYALRYESYNRNANVDQLELLITDRLKPQETALLRAAQDFAGEQKRPQIKNMETGFFNNLKKLHKIVGLADVENVYTQHRPLISSLMAQILQPAKSGQRGDARETRFGSYTQLSKHRSDNQSFDELIIFIVGGVTYEESLFVHEWNNNPANGGKRVVLGGSGLLNSKAFLKEINQFRKSKDADDLL